MYISLVAGVERCGAGSYWPLPKAQLFPWSSEGQRVQLIGQANGGKGKPKPGTGKVVGHRYFFLI